MTTSPNPAAPAVEPPRPAVLHIVQTSHHTPTLRPGLLFTGPLTPIWLHINNADGTYTIAHLAGEELTVLTRDAAACGCP
ncbi:hypothetical protein ETD86_37375 [Nonomuraea turkmeniaca]|uniref:Uncharacterized protein n=1 Tax=Nonomuraea turkmeniaca TaxID=103838 RepID=A0A5S4F4L4_9ACTN|nr:hypothetical protein [Nonomuraea turkmeniaca]TMR10990.1 hypothetical protein ETD86_37375 [Nonomuraea turkmeniaca]